MDENWDLGIPIIKHFHSTVLIFPTKIKTNFQKLFDVLTCILFSATFTISSNTSVWKEEFCSFSQLIHTPTPEHVHRISCTNVTSSRTYRNRNMQGFIWNNKTPISLSQSNLLHPRQLLKASNSHSYQISDSSHTQNQLDYETNTTSK